MDVKVPAGLIAKANKEESLIALPESYLVHGVGKCRTDVNTSNGEGDDDWVPDEQIGVDGDRDGDVEAAQLLWDDEDNVLYVYAENNSLRCAEGLRRPWTC